MQQQNVASLALREAVLVSADMPVGQVIDTMRERQLGCAIVLDEQSQPLGQFTEFMLVQFLLRHSDKLNEPVSEHMDVPCHTIGADEPIAEAVEQMRKDKLRFLAVTDNTGHVTALTGQKGLMEYVADHFPHLVLGQRIGQRPFLDQREGG